MAALAAEQHGEPFTRFVTIHWTRAGVADERAAEATGSLTKLAKDWARRHRARILYAWVRECDKAKGSHVHMLIASPAHLPIGRMWRRWLRLITGRPYRAGTINTRRIGGSLSAPLSNPAAYHQHLFNVTGYACKGVPLDDAAGLGLRRVEDGGSVIGKRSAVCQSLLAICR